MLTGPGPKNDGDCCEEFASTADLRQQGLRKLYDLWLSEISARDIDTVRILHGMIVDLERLELDLKR